MHWYTDVLKKYAVFSGRASRKEYWMFFLWNIIISFFIGVLIGIVTTATGVSKDTGDFVQAIYSLAIMMPSIAVAFRRLHDTGRSGWWLGGELMFIAVSVLITIGLVLMGANIALLILIPFVFIPVVAIYSIVLTVFLIQKGMVGKNKYGPDPKSSEHISKTE